MDHLRAVNGESRRNAGNGENLLSVESGENCLLLTTTGDRRLRNGESQGRRVMTSDRLSLITTDQNPRALHDVNQEEFRPGTR